MKKVNNICVLAVTTSTFAVLVSPVVTQAAGFYDDRAATTTTRINERFMPLGLRFGGFNVNASMGVTADHISNAQYTQSNEQSDTILTATPSVYLSSDWGRHSLNLGTRIAANKYSKFEKDSTTDWTMFANGRYDITGRTRLGANLSVSRGTQGRDSNEVAGNILRPIRTNQYAGSVSIETEFNRLRFLGKLETTKYKYNGVAGGINQHFRDVTIYDSVGRLDYAISPDTSIYVYGVLNKRTHDNVGNLDSKGHVLAVGARFDLSTLITGEVEAGTMKQDYKSFTAKESNAYYRANVVWSPTPLTSVTGKLSREDAVTSAIGAIGSLRTNSSLNVDHELLRNLVVGAGLSRSNDQYRGINREDKRDTVRATGNYYLSSRVAFNGELKHEKLESTGLQGFRSYKNNVVRVGLILNY